MFLNSGWQQKYFRKLKVIVMVQCSAIQFSVIWHFTALHYFKLHCTKGSNPCNKKTDELQILSVTAPPPPPPLVADNFEWV